MKDLFSATAQAYARYRPVYPRMYYDYVLSLVSEKNNAWDCATGNGQVAVELARHFAKVWATDISATQLSHAPVHPHLVYSVQAAEKTNFPPAFFDLVTVAQAVHWFDFDAFYAEVNRTLRPGGLLSVTGYGRPRTSKAVDEVLDDLYFNIVGPYWDKERKYIDDHYLTIPFPFAEEKSPVIEQRLEWDITRFVGYLRTWSAVGHFIKARGFDPVEGIRPQLEKAWGSQKQQQVVFPLLMRTGRKNA